MARAFGGHTAATPVLFTVCIVFPLQVIGVSAVACSGACANVIVNFDPSTAQICDQVPHM
jgi:hypothetical protein